MINLFPMRVSANNPDTMIHILELNNQVSGWKITAVTFLSERDSKTRKEREQE